MRDDFSEEVKRVVAARVGNRCSRPDCWALTSGPQTDGTKALNVGVAAHITAASAKGPRYNPALTMQQRKHTDNAIWLCQNCGKLVDNDPAKYTEVVLRDWKNRAEAAALAEIGKTKVHDSDTLAIAVFDLPRSPVQEISENTERLHSSAVWWLCIENDVNRIWKYDAVNKTAQLGFVKEKEECYVFTLALENPDIEHLEKRQSDIGYWNLACLEPSMRGSLKLQMKFKRGNFLTFYWTNYAINQLLETALRQFTNDWDLNVSLGKGPV